MAEQNIINIQHTLQNSQAIQDTFDKLFIVLVTNELGVITYANQLFCEISQYPPNELIGQHFRKICAADQEQTLFQNIIHHLAQGEMWKGEICNIAKDGSLYWTTASIVPSYNAYQKVDKYVTVFTEITEPRALEATLEHTHHDELTGLPSRRAFHQRIDNEIKRAKLDNKPFAIFDMDINRFKSINDGLGHTIGDQFLIEVAQRLVSIDAHTNSFYRQGADEFTFVLTDISLLDKMALKIMDQFKKPFVIDGHKFYSSVSIGISIFPEHAAVAEDLVNNADLAMLRAKKRKGNNYYIFNAHLENQELKDITLETKLYDALRLDQLQLHYQPKIDLQTGKLVGMEALLRWIDADLGFVPPDRFIPFAEETGLIVPIGEWVLQRACLDAKSWNDLFDLNLRVAVNLSPIQLALPHITDTIQKIVHDTNLDTAFLEIEITEMSMVNFNKELIDKLAQIRQMGITISIDDFGTGYSSLSYLKNLPVDALKIDRSFIMEIGVSPTGSSMVGAIISLAHAMNLGVVAEGVERPEELAYLKACGCELAQGYYFSKPLPADQFFQYVLTQSM